MIINTLTGVAVIICIINYICLKQPIMKTLKTLILAAILLTGSAYAQKWSEGKDLSYLKGQKELLFKFTYDNLTVGKQSEQDYIKDKVTEYNKKEAGKGDSWAKEWVDVRSKVYEPKFEELFNKEADGHVTGDRTKSSAKYTVMIHTIRTEPGWNIGFSKMPASCDFEITIVETANPTVVKSKGILKNMPGSQFAGADFDVSARVKECYAKGGKELGHTLGKATKE